MDTLAINPIKSMKETIKGGIAAAMTYDEYRELVHHYAIEESNTGSEKTTALANYTQLNDRRMRRWDKTLRIPEAVEQKIKGLRHKITWLVLTESWCGDASPSLPVMNKLANMSQNLELKIILRDEHTEVMDLFLTNGTRSIPKLIALDTLDHQVIGEWGPRSTKATQMVATYRAKHGVLTPEFKEELQVWYNTDKGQDIINDLVDLLALK